MGEIRHRPRPEMFAFTPELYIASMLRRNDDPHQSAS